MFFFYCLLYTQVSVFLHCEDILRFRSLVKAEISSGSILQKCTCLLAIKDINPLNESLLSHEIKNLHYLMKDCRSHVNLKSQLNMVTAFITFQRTIYIRLWTWDIDARLIWIVYR